MGGKRVIPTWMARFYLCLCRPCLASLIWGSYSSRVGFNFSPKGEEDYDV
jgi:hypothetical protein